MTELRRVTLMAAMLALTLLPLPASGAIGPVATGMTGSATDATTAFYSPAGLTRLEQPELVMQTMLAYTSAKFRIDSATTPGGSAEKEHSLLVVPGLFYSRPLRDRISMGLSFNAAGGIGNDYGGGWSGRYISENASLALVAASSAVAFQVTDGLSLAVGPYAIFVDSESRVRVNNVAPGAAEGSVELERLYIEHLPIYVGVHAHECLQSHPPRGALNHPDSRPLRCPLPPNPSTAALPRTHLHSDTQLPSPHQAPTFPRCLQCTCLHIHSLHGRSRSADKQHVCRRKHPRWISGTGRTQGAHKTGRGFVCGVSVAHPNCTRTPKAQENRISPPRICFCSRGTGKYPRSLRT